ncbi:hypothetical protein [Streptomyces xiangluensis]|uniref:hypothetical protein n=1 Tax=Streptomyces xiangluensis TaxID=2665720 RepID=UPI0036D77EC0
MTLLVGRDGDHGSDAVLAQVLADRAALGPTGNIKHGSQHILLEIIQAARHPWCCHGLCLLLGDARRPLSRRALQARMTRLTRRLAECDMSFTITNQWGRTTFVR